jgi:hypothetical protein
MRSEESKPTSTQLKEGQQESSRQNRGYQVGLDKGYQPKSQVSAMQPPPVGTTTVVPVKNSGTHSTHSGNGAKK